MPDGVRLLIVSDIHYAGPAEKTRGQYETRFIGRWALRRLARAYRYFIWMRDPFAHNHLLESVLDPPFEPDWVVANGDFSCDSAFIGVSDPAAFESARDCLEQLRGRYADKLLATIGDHELGKMSLFGGKGGLRLASWRRAVEDLELKPFWQISAGPRKLAGVASSLIALPIYLPETELAERDAWRKLRVEHLAQIRDFFAKLRPKEKVILFCHDPTALPFLWEAPEIRERAGQIERTVIGHLHTPLVFWKSRVLAGMPPIRCLGNTVRRLSSALAQARLWRPFKPALCPSLAGCELLKDGGFLRAEIPLDSGESPQFHLHRVPRSLPPLGS